MNFFITYFIAYILSQSGFLLGKSTKEEHKEIKKFVKIFGEVLVFITYVILFYLFNSSMFLFLLSANLVLQIFSFFNLKYYLKEIHNVLLLGLSILILNEFYFDYLFIAILPIMIIFFDKSFQKFNLKLEFYQLILYLIIYLLIN